MEPERLSDAQLTALVRDGGKSADAALMELEGRHFGAVRDFAEICAHDSAPDELAARAWQRAVRHHDEGVAGALRPHALRLVLRTAAESTDTGSPGPLDADSAAWLAAVPTPWEEDSAGGGVAFLGSGSVVALAFDALPVTFQTAMWHHLVEHADNESVALLLGSESPEAQEISVTIRRAYRDFYHAYERIHHEAMADDCRRFHRMVMAYADHKGGNTADVVAHLQQCGYCSRAVADLEQLNANPGELLARELLPWEGQEYAASRRAEWVSATIEVPFDGAVGPAHGAAADALSAAPAPSPAPSRGRRVLGTPSRRAPARRAGPTGRGGSGYAGVRAQRLYLAVGALGVCSLAVAFTYSQGFGGPKPPQRSAEQPAEDVPSTPAPSKSGARGPSGSAEDPPSSPAGSGGGGTKPPSEGRDGRSSSPAVRGAALEWLFGKVKGGETEDSSGNDRHGTLVGDPRPKPQKADGIAFFGQQSVASQGPVFDTDSSFSVSARVKLRNKNEYQTVASQDGAEISSFQLQYDAVEDRWEMRMHRSDSQTSRADEAESDAAPRANRWTFLTGVWDESEQQIRLYVDGRLEDTARRTGDRSSEGDFAVGRARLGNEFIRGLEGNVREVRAFPEALTDAQARRLAREE